VASRRDIIPRDRAIQDLAADGWTPVRIAVKLGLTIPIVQSVLRKQAKLERDVASDRERKRRRQLVDLADFVVQRPLPERLETLRDAWLEAAGLALVRLTDPEGGSQLDLQTASTATRRAMDIDRHLATGNALPEVFPDGDEARRRVVLQAWWSAARAGSPTASRYLAQALGVRDARQQTIELVWADQLPQLPQLPGGADGQVADLPPGEAPAPGGDPRLH
jgi:hypothetical protein